MTDIRDLIVAAGASDSDLEDVVRQIGVERVADMLVYELVDRADLNELGDTADVTVQFELRAGDRRVARAVRARGGTAACEAGTAASPDATVVQDLVDLARAVFGPRPERANATRSIVWRDPGAAGTPSRSRWANEAPQVTHRLLRGSEDRPEDLAELLLRFGSGRWGIHRSPQQYARHFGPLRDRSLTILELPAGGYDDPDTDDSSLRAWKRYFRRAMVYRIDVVGRYELLEQRVRTLRGRRMDPRFLSGAVAQTGPLDIVIDACHDRLDVTASFGLLFPHLRPGGIYVIEDVGSGNGLPGAATTAGFFTSLVDRLSYREFDPPAEDGPAETGTTAAGVHFYRDLVVVEKGADRDGKPALAPAPKRRRLARGGRGSPEKAGSI